ncbi:IS110 family transposase [Mangrovicoccus ximenensis]|uniref:IS110 family transposase n=1 Tax=Mangrovicoccus ximenensis TaxID=1911570 RepID=UPI00191BD632|nr:transposase [Mangrovicoccus ximenensis]
MGQHVGPDVSLKENAISVREDGSRIWRGKCASDPGSVAEIIRRHAPRAERAVFGSGPLATWFCHALTAKGIPAICIEARHAQRILNETLNKTDANDADGLARIAEAGFCKEVRAKAFGSMPTRTLIALRSQIVGMSIQLGNQIRGVMKTFGLIVPKGKGRIFEANVRALLDGRDDLARIILPLLGAWSDMRSHVAGFDRQLRAAARQDRYPSSASGFWGPQPVGFRQRAGCEQELARRWQALRVSRPRGAGRAWP